MYLLSQNAKATRVANGAAAGTGTTNGDSVDMRGFDTVTFYLLIGSITGGGSVEIKAQQSSDDGSSDAFADLEDTAVSYTDNDGNKVAILEVSEPRERYVRPVVTRSGANSVLDGVLAVQARAQDEPVTHDSASVVATELHLAPAEGTA